MQPLDHRLEFAECLRFLRRKKIGYPTHVIHQCSQNESKLRKHIIAHGWKQISERLVIFIPKSNASLFLLYESSVGMPIFSKADDNFI